MLFDSFQGPNSYTINSHENCMRIDSFQGPNNLFV